MTNPRRATGRKVPPYPNQWKPIRRTRGLTQREVARALGHLNVNYYKLIERGLRFPGPRILFLLLALMRVGLHQAYPRLAGRAEDALKEHARRRTRRDLTQAL